MNLPERAQITQATLDRWLGVPFAWGRADCGRLVAWHLKAFGHRVALSHWGQFRSALGAKAALRRRGHANMVDALDSIPSLLRLPAPAFALPGDIFACPGDDAFGAVAIYLGNGRALGWREGSEECAVVSDITAFDGGWHV